MAPLSKIKGLELKAISTKAKEISTSFHDTKDELSKANTMCNFATRNEDAPYRAFFPFPILLNEQLCIKQSGYTRVTVYWIKDEEKFRWISIKKFDEMNEILEVLD